MDDGYKIKKRIEQGKQAKSDGDFFERMILDACFRYQMRGDAFIEKTPEPLKPIKRLPSGRFSARYDMKAQPDFKGTLNGGRAICFEAKATNSDRIACNRLQPQQIDALKLHERLGAVVFILVMFLKENQCFRVPLKYWLSASDLYGRNYFKIEELKEFLIPTAGMKIDFLKDPIKTDHETNEQLLENHFQEYKIKELEL